MAKSRHVQRWLRVVCPSKPASQLSGQPAHLPRLKSPLKPLWLSAPCLPRNPQVPVGKNITTVGPGCGWGCMGVQQSVITHVHAGAARASDEGMWSRKSTLEPHGHPTRICGPRSHMNFRLKEARSHLGPARNGRQSTYVRATLEPHGRPRICGHARPRWSRTGVRESVVTHVHAGAARASESLWSRTSTLKPHGCPRVCGHARPRRSRTGVRESVVTHAHAGAARASESLWSRASTPVTPGAARRSGKASPAPALPAARASAAYPGQG